MDKIEKIVAEVKIITYHDDISSFSVIKVDVENSNEKNYLTITGNFPRLEINTTYEFSGEYVSHPRYGKQFKLMSYEKVVPTTKSGIIKYLSSPIFKGIGVKKATKIVESLGEDTIDKIKKDTSVLRGLVSIKDQKTIVEAINSSNYFEEAMQMFITQGLSMKTLSKIQAVYGEEMIEVIQNNPYSLVEEIDGFNFNTADNFAIALGFKLNDERRIKAAIIHSINNLNFRNGGTFVLLEEILIETIKILPTVVKNDIEDNILSLIEERKIIKEKEKYFYFKQYDAEQSIAHYLTRFIKRIPIEISFDDIEPIINNIEKVEGITYDDEQINALLNCLNNSVSIITGGPGTGKTTIVKALVRTYKELIKSDDIFVCAPTGRAAKRLSELTGVEATTIHRLLKWDLHSNTFSINKSNPLIGDLLIIDEFSMVDNLLFYHLLNATMNFSKIVIIGDDDQLPSVSPGNVLNDLLESDFINTIRLNKIYRQKETSNIVSLAHNIKNSLPLNDNFQDDVIFYSTSNENIKKSLLQYLDIAKNNGYDADDIQVLAPMYMGPNGIDVLNELLQNYFNPASEDKNEFTIGRRIYRENDKILQLKNQTEDNVFNGDIGTLVEIKKLNHSITFIVDFDGNFVEYGNKDLINITHAFCISIHKSQGSEYPLIVFPITNEYYHMLNKKLIYTGITRAKRKLILIGNYNAFVYGVNNDKIQTRNTNLKQFLQNSVNFPVKD